MVLVLNKIEFPFDYDSASKNNIFTAIVFNSKCTTMQRGYQKKDGRGWGVKFRNAVVFNGLNHGDE